MGRSSVCRSTASPPRPSHCRRGGGLSRLCRGAHPPAPGRTGDEHRSNAVCSQRRVSSHRPRHRTVRHAPRLVWRRQAPTASILLRTIAAGRLPLSNIRLEFSRSSCSPRWSIFVRALVRVRQLGAIVLPLIVAMAAYVWLLPADLREVDALIPAPQNQPSMTAHVSMAILAYAALPSPSPRPSSFSSRTAGG